MSSNIIESLIYWRYNFIYMITIVVNIIWHWYSISDNNENVDHKSFQKWIHNRSWFYILFFYGGDLSLYIIISFSILNITWYVDEIISLYVLPMRDRIGLRFLLMQENTWLNIAQYISRFIEYSILHTTKIFNLIEHR